MKNEVLKDILLYAIKQLKANYEYCSCAEGESVAMLNSTDGFGNDITIKFEIDY